MNLNKLDWKFDKDTQQRLYLNKNTNRMLEIMIKRLGNLYKRSDDIADDKLVSWEYEAKIPNFPFLALSVTSHPTMLSPSFEHMFDFNYKDKLLRIIETRSQSVVKEFPPDLITIEEGENEIDGIRKVYAKVWY